MSVARRRKATVCFNAGSGVFGRVVARKLWIQAVAGYKCFPLRCCVSSAAMLVLAAMAVGSTVAEGKESRCVGESGSGRVAYRG